jgi:iron complex outermembrane receptor protein
VARIIDRVLISAATAALIQTYGASVRADEAAADTDRGGALEEIVVTARKRSESAQIAPLSLSAISSEDLQAAHLTRLDDLSGVAPNLTITQNSATVGVTQATIRGIVNADYNLLNDSPIGIYIDGVVLARATGALMGLVDLERVEVLRGPQGTLFGRNTSGGAVALYSKGPAQEFGFQQKLTYGSHNDLISRSTLDTGKFGPFTAKLTFAHHTYDGWERNLQTASSEGVGALDSNAVLFALHADVLNSLTADYRFDYDTEKDRPGFDQVVSASAAVQGAYANSVALGGVPLVVSQDRQGTVNQTDLGPDRLKVLGHSVTVNYDRGDAFKIKSISAYRSVDTTYNTVIGSGPLSALIGKGAPATGFAPYVVGTNDLYNNGEFDHQYQMSQELQFLGQVDRFNYVAGLYWFDERVRLDSNLADSHLAVPIQLAPTFFITLLSPQPTQYHGESRSYAGFTNVSYTPAVLDDKLEVTVGARETRDRKVLHQTFFGATGLPLAGAAGFRDLARDFGNTSESASLKYQWDPDFMTYLRWSKGYKAGGFNPRNTSILSATGYGPEQAKSWEVGAKSELLDKHLRLNAAVFYTKYDDLQVSVIQPSLNAGVQTITDNAGKADYRGGELEITLLPATGWQISASAGYVSPKFEQYITDRTTTPVTDIASTARFGSTSKLTGSLRVQYSLEHYSFGDLSVAPSWTYMSGREFGSNPATSPRIDAIHAPAWSNVGAQITLANISMGSLGNGLTAQLYGKNLLNKYQRIDGIDFGTLGYAVNGFGPGREFGIEVTASF